MRFGEQGPDTAPDVIRGLMADGEAPDRGPGRAAIESQIRPNISGRMKSRSEIRMMKATTTETGINEESRKRRIIIQKNFGDIVL